MERQQRLSTSQPTGVGVVGLGFMGRVHVAAYQSASTDGHACRLAAVADGDAEKRSGKMPAGGNLEVTDGETSVFDPSVVAAYATADELLADDAVELVSICTPTDTHVELATKALEAGKHVLLEKPVSVETAAVRRLADVAARMGKHCMPAMCMRFWPGWTWLRDRVDDQSLGQLQSLSLTRLGAKPAWNAFYADVARSGGALLDLHIHDTDFVTAIVGRPDAVTTVGSLDAMTTIYHVAGGQRIVAEGGWHHPGSDFRMRFVADFEHATADFDLARETPLLLCRDGEAKAVALPSESGYDAEIRHLVDAIATGGKPSLSLSDAVLTHEVMDAERTSLETGRRVSL